MKGNPTKRLLLVDDDAETLNSLKQLFQATLPQVEILVARDGESALRMLQDNPVDVIISDYVMPGMDGLHFMSQAARLRPHARRLIITAFPDPTLAARAVHDAGVALLIAKPFDLEFLASMVSSMLTDSGAASARMRRKEER